jgi:hypothetical protein
MSIERSARSPDSIGKHGKAVVGKVEFYKMARCSYGFRDVLEFIIVKNEFFKCR